MARRTGTRNSIMISNGQAYRPTGVNANGKMKLRALGSARKKSNGGAGG